MEGYFEARISTDEQSLSHAAVTKMHCALLNFINSATIFLARAGPL
jgi:hypothetical protein